MEINVNHRKKARFAVGADTGEDDEPVVCFLWVPDKDKFDHEHIELSRDSAVALYNWLDEYLTKS